MTLLMAEFESSNVIFYLSLNKKIIELAFAKMGDDEFLPIRIMMLIVVD